MKVAHDLRPIALTSCTMKVFERLVLIRVQEQVADFINPCQFAYRSNKAVGDAVLHVLNTIDSYLEKPRTCIHLMFLMTFRALFCWQIDENDCRRLYNSVDFRLLNELPTVCQTGIRSYIRSCIHQHWWATGYLFVTIPVYPVHCRLPEYS